MRRFRRCPERFRRHAITVRRPALRFALLAAFALGGSTSAALAHAFLDRAAPAVGSTVRTSPPTVRMWFTEALEPAFSGASVVDAKGRPVTSGKARVADGGHMVLEVPLQTLPAGRYTVSWEVVSVDTHKTTGTFSFVVAR